MISLIILLIMFVVILPAVTHPVHAATITVYVNANSDDGTDVAGDSTFHTVGHGDEASPWTGTGCGTSSGCLAVGGTNVSGSVQTSGFRFTNITIPQGSTINSASFDLLNNWFGNYLTNISTKVYGSKVSNLDTFSDTNLPRSVTKTTASVTWNSTNDPSTGNQVWFSTTTSSAIPSVTALVQEIVNQSGWSSGNSLGMIITDNGGNTDWWWEPYAYDSGIGNTAKLVIDYTPPTTVTSNGFTLAAWVNPSTSVATKALMVKNNEVRMVTDASGHVLCQMHDGTGWQTATGTTVLSLNSWQHTACSFDTDRKLRVFVNGAQDGVTQMSSMTINTSTSSLRIGDDEGATYGDYNGRMDEIRVYSRALSPSEIRQLFNWAPGPVGSWNLDEPSGNRADASGNGNSLTDTNTVRSVTGKFGKAAEYENLPTDYDQSLVITNANQRNLDITGPFTIEAWFKTHTTLNFQGITGKDGGAGNRGYGLAINASNKVRLLMSADGTATTTLNGDTSVVPETWYHAAGVWDGSNMYLYLNGVSDGTPVAFTGSVFKTTGPFGIGGRGASGVTDGFDGALDDVRVYNYARTVAQIVEDMNGGHPAPGSPVGSPILHWKFDELTGSTAYNNGYGGSSMNGTVTGATWYGAGKAGGALSTGTSTNTVSAGDPLFVDSATGLTTGFWVKPAALATNKALLTKSNFSNQNSFGIVTDATNSDEIRVHIPTTVSDTGTYFTTTNLNLANDTWSYVTVIYNASESASARIRVYKDGKEISGSVTGTLPDKTTSGTTSTLVIGASGSGTYTALNAVFDEVKIFPYALTYDQMLIDYNGRNAMVLGSLTDTSGISGGSVASNSASTAFCVPGSSDTCRPPIGWWKHDENTGSATTADSSGNGFSGAMENLGNSDWVPGKTGSALKFDGSPPTTQDNINIYSSGFDTLFDPTNGSLSVWIKITDPSVWTDATARKAVTLRYDSNHEVYIQKSATNNYLDIIYEWHTGTNTCTGRYLAGTYSDTNWRHIEVTWNRSAAQDVEIYINGTEVPLSPNTYTSCDDTVTTLSSAETVIGARNTSGTDPWMGYIDDVRVYSYARTPAQVAWDYNNGAPVAWWKLDECQGTTINDSSGNGYSATLTVTSGGTGNRNNTPGTCGSAVSTEAWNNGTNGKFNGSVDFEGTLGDANVHDYVKSSTANFRSTDYWGTLTAWVKPVNFTRAGFIFSSADEGSTNRFLGLYVDTSGYLETDQQNADSEKQIRSNTALVAGQWSHIAFISDGSVWSMYINGKLQGLTTVTGTNTGAWFADVANRDNFAIGFLNWSTNYKFGLNAQIDEVKIYNYPLTRQQVLSDMNQASAVRFGP